MLVLSCPYKLRLLEGILRKSLPQTIVVHGAVMNINRGNPVGHEVIVDSWPEFKVVLTRPCKEIVTDPSDMYTNVYAAFYQDLDAYRRLVKDTDAVNWDHTFHLFGTQEGIPEATQDAAAAKQTNLSVTPHFLYVLSDPNKWHTGRLEPGFRLSSLNSSNVDLLNETWPYGRNEQSRRYLAKMIQHFPSSGILNQEGHLISWALMDLFGTQTHGYTLPSFRGKGYLAITAKALCMQAYKAGYPLYGFVVLNNNNMQRALEKGGYQKLSELSYLCFHS
ncbi:glycine N-acyltransferase-like protein 3 isoform X1 [Pantherophis guttatus]|uniref:Glycine N-acyltransferase-like protein n=1 Tax=Pantherophis guttatus TaxID=94885 RepID=A0A6P9DC69_PANGU|nr:glycine N-acyltransferase-like protein 3 isoform X1 [Pantherophis guttatus]